MKTKHRNGKDDWFLVDKTLSIANEYFFFFFLIKRQAKNDFPKDVDRAIFISNIKGKRYT